MRSAKRQTEARSKSLLQSLPAVTELLERPASVALIVAHGRAAVVDAIRACLADARAALARGDDDRGDALLDGAIAARVARAGLGTLRPVVNATGVIVHTNLGRAPLAKESLDALRAAGEGYATLEYDLDAGARGDRHAHAVALLAALTGAEDALVVNNNAAAVLLAVGTFASGREVVVSRGELVEIGGGFRVPDILRQSGARLVEVGATNRTHLEDYARAIGPETAALLKVHPSNFAMVGFTCEVSLASLAPLARASDIPLLYDAGSGCMPAMARASGEVPVAAHVRAGADLVMFSGDKLLGGPQAGIVVGTRARIEPMRKNPLFRALRADKLRLAALVATLRLWRDSPLAVPVLRMAALSRAELTARSQRLLSRLGALGWPADVVASTGRLGGGSAPTRALESAALRLRAPDPELFCQRLRASDPPIVARIEDGAVLVDLRCVPEELDVALAVALLAAADG